MSGAKKKTLLKDRGSSNRKSGWLRCASASCFQSACRNGRSSNKAKGNSSDIHISSATHRRGAEGIRGLYMDFIFFFIDFILRLDQHLIWLIQNYGIWVYLILFLIIFLETGLVITPFLPGDSLLFAVGALAASGQISIVLLFAILCAAAILGDTVNYWVGNRLGLKLIKKTKLLKAEHIERTKKFFDKYGGKTIILARFVPVIRTFAPFMAGIGTMKYPKFLSYNVIGGITWVSLFLFGGFFFGNIPFVKENFTAVIFAIIIISFMPMVIEYLRHRRG